MQRAAIVSALALAACGGGRGGAVPPQDVAAGEDAPTDVAVGPEPTRQVDLLFVIGDSPSMQDQLPNLSANFANMIDVLGALQGGLPDVHIGVVSTDLGAKGSEDAVPGAPTGSGPGACADEGKAGNLLGSSSVSGNFLVDVKNTDGSRTKNYTGTLAEAFTSMASIGASGCLFQQPLEAMKRALAPTHPTNQGFLRTDAVLAVVFILSEDDCSMAHSTLMGPDGGPLGPLEPFRCTRFGVKCDVGGATDAAMNQVGVKDQCHPDDASQHLAVVSAYVDFLNSIKTDPSKIVVSGIVGTNDPFAVELRTINGSMQPVLAHSCTYEGPDGVLNTTDDQAADPAIRLSFFFGQFPGHATQTTICQADLSGGLVLIGEHLEP